MKGSLILYPDLKTVNITHGVNITYGSCEDKWSRIWAEDLVDPTELRIEFEADVMDSLGTLGSDLSVLPKEDLSGHAINDVTQGFDGSVDGTVLATDQYHDQV